jgi:hypothetical protein
MEELHSNYQVLVDAWVKYECSTSLEKNHISISAEFGEEGANSVSRGPPKNTNSKIPCVSLCILKIDKNLFSLLFDC